MERSDFDDRLRHLVEASHDGIAVLVDGALVEVNDTLARMSGYDAAELLGETPAVLVAPDRLDEVMRRIAEEDESVYQTEIVRKDGARIEVQVRGIRISIGGRSARLAVIRDLSALQRVTRELVASERRWRAFLEQASDGVFVANETLRLVEVNAAACEMLGYSREELLQMSVPDIGEPVDLAAQGLHLQAMQEGKVSRTERRMLRKDGSTFYAAVSARFLPDLGVYHAIARDITAQREAQERLLRSEARFRTMTEHLPDAVAVLSEGRVVYVNPACLRLLGAQRLEDVVGRSWLEFVHADERDDATRRIEAATDGGATVAVQRRLAALDGRQVLTRVITLPIVYDGEHALMSIMRDVTEQTRLEAQLRRAQRMEAVGRMAGGIAHDFNNMLSVILNYADLGRRDVAKGSPPDHALSQIAEAARRSAALTRQLLSFSRHQVVEAEVVDPSEVVRRTVQLLRGTLGEHVELRCIVDEQPHRVHIPPSQLEQVIVNLAVNAREAMPCGGKLTLEVRGAAERWVEIVARDTGEGMEPQVVEHAFEPFFSTKEQGEASGLGLSMVYGIVTRNGGTVELDSEPGRGTEVTIRLPVVHAEKTRPAAREPSPRRQGRGEHIVVVEDEPAVRTVVLRLLERHGYQARAATPEEAIEQVRTGERVDLVLTDVVMPGMNGRELARAVTALNPAIGVLYMSGYAEDVVEGVEVPGGFVSKPFTADELLAAVETALSRSPP